MGITPITVSGVDALGRNVARAAPDGQHHLDDAAVRQSGDVVVWVEDLELGRDVDVGRHDLAGFVFVKSHLHLVELSVQAAHELLEVQDDVGHVLLDTLDGGELVGDPFDLYRADSRPFERRQQNPAQRVAERMPEAAVERFDLKARPIAGELLARDVGHLKLKQLASCWVFAAG